MTPEQISLVKDSFDHVAGEPGAVAKAALTAAYTLRAGVMKDAHTPPPDDPSATMATVARIRAANAGPHGNDGCTP